MFNLQMMKRRKLEPEKPTSIQFGNFNEDILHEVLRHVDARTLATAACVSKQWQKTAHDERLWEVICTRHWGKVDDVPQQLRSVVLALGGFRRLYALCLWPLMKKKPHQLPTGSLTKNNNVAKVVQWGKDEVHLSLCLLSIWCYEKMTFNYKR